MPRKIILLSGGVDSMVLLAMYASEKPMCITFSYGQRHRKELNSAYRIASHYGVNLDRKVVVINPLRGSALTEDCEVPMPSDDQSPTVVPGRNAIFLSVAANYASPGDTILYGAHAGDFSVYPDCRDDFVTGISKVFEQAYGVTVDAPFKNQTKAGIVQAGRFLNVPFHLAWTCYRGLDEPCGECSACVGLQKAMSNE
jgi:7-cyano-7-deazaguanine synthase